MKSTSSSLMPTLFVIFGATGDLTRKKLIPALFSLYTQKLLPELFHVVGFARRAMPDDAFQTYVVDVLHETQKVPLKQARAFSKQFTYTQGTFEERDGYDRLAGVLGRNDNEWHTCANKLFYLATSPDYFETIFRALARSELTAPCSEKQGWTRVIVEKPFGRDRETAKELDKLMGKLFKEEQIYRMDHYLGKETVQNILAFRFSNSFLTPAWNKDNIERITLQLLERASIGERGGFYDNYGALRDVGQNHLLQMLAWFTMDAPASFDPAAIRARRAEILSTLPKLGKRAIAQSTVRGQYKGFTQSPGVARESKTETYFKIETKLESQHFAGVPIVLESGHGLAEDRVEVTVLFRHPERCLCPPEAGKHYRNVLRYRIQPNERITISFWVKKPGNQMVLEEKDFIFDYRASYPDTEFFEAYSKLLLDAINGNQTLFVSTDEIMASWRFIDPIIKHWAREVVPLQKYALHLAGPPMSV